MEKITIKSTVWLNNSDILIYPITFPIKIRNTSGIFLRYGCCHIDIYFENSHKVLLTQMPLTEIINLTLI